MIPVLPGDGIGPVVIREAVRALRAVGVGELEEFPFGYGCWQREGRSLPERTEAAIRAAGVALLGAATTPEVGCPSPILGLRRALGLDLLVRPAAGLVLVGLTWEGLYAEPEGEDGARRNLTPAAIDRVLTEAFRRAHRKVTIVDKPTVFRVSAARWRASAERLATVPWELVNADAFVASVVRDRAPYDVVVAESFVGDVLSDLFAALGEGIGGAPSAAIGPACAVFEPVHGSAPRRVEVPPTVDPRGALRAAAMLLDHLGQTARAERIRAALAAVGPLAGPTSAVGDAVVAALRAGQRA